MGSITSVAIWFFQLLFGTSNYQWFITNDPLTYYIVILFACVLILSTVSFIFKFLLKLVER